MTTTMKTPIRTTGRWISILVNLYRLSDGRYWLDDVYMNRQFIVSGAYAEQLIPLLTPYTGYEGETLDSLQSDYGMEKGHQVPELPRPYSFLVDPAGPSVTIP